GRGRLLTTGEFFRSARERHHVSQPLPRRSFSIPEVIGRARQLLESRSAVALYLFTTEGNCWIASDCATYLFRRRRAQKPPSAGRPGMASSAASSSASGV